MHHDALTRRHIHSGEIIDWEFLASQGLDQAFFESINKDPLSGPQWVNLFQINESVYRELVREFFASFEFDASPCRYDPNHLGVRFRLGGEQREISLLELGWRVGLYSERQSRENATLSRLRKGVTVKANHLLLGFWPIIGDGGFNIGNTKLHNGACFWPAAREVEEKDKEDDEANEAAGGNASNEGAGGSANIYRNMSQDITNQIACRNFLIKNEEEIFTVRGDGARIKPDGVASPAMLYLTRRSLEVLRKFHWTTLGGRSNQLSQVSSPLLSKPR
ncbi:hypothetical protein Tco_0935153 [Tanacetum coccineum]